MMVARSRKSSVKCVGLVPDCTCRHVCVVWPQAELELAAHAHAQQVQELEARLRAAEAVQAEVRHRARLLKVKRRNSCGVWVHLPALPHAICTPVAHRIQF